MSNKRTSTMANFSPIPNNDKKLKLINDITQITSLSKDVVENPNTPDYAKTIIQQLSAMLAATAELLHSQQQQQLAMDPHELERLRSVVLIGLPESTKEKATERAAEDEETVRKVLDDLEVECLPQTVYRLGRPDPKKTGGRLIKVVLPARTFQWRTLGQWKKKREEMRKSEDFRRLLIRPSLTPQQLSDERKRREERAINPSGFNQKNV